MRDSVTYIAVVRHPLDVAMSDRDHAANMKRNRAIRLRKKVAGKYEPAREAAEIPDDPAEFLRWFIDNDEPATGSGPERPGRFLRAGAHLLDSARPAERPSLPLLGHVERSRHPDASRLGRPGRADRRRSFGRSWSTRRPSSRCARGPRSRLRTRISICGANLKGSSRLAAAATGRRCCRRTTSRISTAGCATWRRRDRLDPERPASRRALSQTRARARRSGSG